MTKRKTRRICVVGSTDFPIDPQTGAELLDIIREYGQGIVLLTRGRGNVDEFILRAAPLIGLRCFAFPARGGSDNWTRDIELVTDADEVIALFSPASLPDLRSGTAHICERALDKGKRVRAFSVVDNRLVFAGELP
jgi:hypothetical protein